ncbi:MAG: GNAT family N-acetyltransferase [Pseudomonadota bacterium]
MTIRLEEVQLSEHAPLIDAWLHLPHVSRWWGDPAWRTVQLRETPDHEHAVIAYDGVSEGAGPIGYVRWQAVDRETLDSVGLTDLPDGSIDIDLFIGDASYLGRGLGVRILNALARHLQQTTDVQVIGLTTSVDNLRALRAFEKAAFQKHLRYDDDTFGPCWILIRKIR